MLKKISQCRSCKSNNLKEVFNLGSQYLTGVFPKKKNTKISSGDLSLCLCKKCRRWNKNNRTDITILYSRLDNNCATYPRDGN